MAQKPRAEGDDAPFVSVPDGWKCFCSADTDGKPNPKKLFIFKNAESEQDILTHVGITLCYYARGDIYVSTRDFYDNVRDIEPFELGGKLFEGYNCTSCSYPYTMLEVKRNGTVFQVMMLMKNGDASLSLQDEDVRFLLQSITDNNQM